MTPPPVPPLPLERAAFLAELRRLKAWSGLSYRELERAAAAAGEVLPYSTAATMLRRDRLPREALLIAFVVACGVGDDDTRRWVAARRHLAMDAQPLDSPAPPPPAAVPATPAPQRPVRRRRSRLRLAAVGVVATVAVLVGAGAATFGTTTVQEERTEGGSHQLLDSHSPLP